jgi:glycosyltransferase 2 family protein
VGGWSVSKGSWQLWLGVAVSLACLVLSLRDVRLPDVMGLLGQVDAGWLAVAVASFVLTVGAKAFRWRMLLALRRAPSLGRAFSILSIGVMANGFMPARLGELIRAYLMGEAEAESKVFVLGTIAVEKIMDVVCLLLAMALVLMHMSLPDWLTGPSEVSALILAIVIPVGLFVAWRRDLVMRLVERVARLASVTWTDWLVRQAGSGLASLDVLRRPGLLAGLMILSAGIWLLSAATNYLVFLAMGLSWSAWAALLLLVVLQVGVAVPSSPGRVGVFHYLVVLTLSVFAVDKGVALGYAVVLHLVVYVPTAILGVWCLWQEKVPWQKLAEAASSLGRLRGQPS